MALIKVKRARHRKGKEKAPFTLLIKRVLLLGWKDDVFIFVLTIIGGEREEIGEV